jgi:septal ring factor EnvC (AmiA/AmiB activator)
MKKHKSAVKSTLWLFSIVCMISASCFAAPFQNNSTKKTTTQLKQVSSAISDTQSEIKKVNQKRKVLEKQLRTDDLAISSVTKNINKNKVTQKQINKDLSLLIKKKSVLHKDKKQQENILAKQLRSAYSSGHHDYLKLLLNQEDPASVQRTLTHYKYINNARIKEIENFKATINQLVTIENQHKQKSNDLNRVMETLAKDKQALEKNKKNRASTIASLKKQQLSKEQKLNELLAQEKNLKSALAKLALKVKPKKSQNGLAKLKRKLSWPVSGRIKHNFGTQKHGYIKWKGILKSAPLGEHVKAIYSGTILFSDWLNGYGLVTIIDHGKGYMSLYGHNQTLLKKVGDYVEKGEPISLVGQSGGQSQPGLYFEIRHVGKAVNPKLWCR